MEGTPLFSVVVPTRRRPTALSHCLHSLAALDYPRELFEVVVVVDGGDVAAVPRVNGLALRIETQPPQGPAAARNRGAALARGRYLAFTDDDCTVPSSWLRDLESALADGARAVGGAVVTAYPSNAYSETSQLLLDYLQRYYNAAPREARFATTNNLALPRVLFADVGGFDPGFRLAGGEDRDLSGRLADDRRMHFDPAIVVTHHNRLTLGGFVRQHFRYGRGAARFHALRTGSARLEPLAFYRGLLRSAGGRGRIALLLALSQLLTGAGYLFEKRLGRRRHRTLTSARSGVS